MVRAQGGELALYCVRKVETRESKGLQVAIDVSGAVYPRPLMNYLRRAFKKADKIINRDIDGCEKMEGMLLDFTSVKEFREFLRKHNVKICSEARFPL